ncbi:MAG: cellulase N-terminal Ig-like domain-containing protein [Lachnospiraceae bacterium]
MKIKVWLSIILCVSMLAGCSFPVDKFLGDSRENSGDSLGLTPDFSYTYEEQTPNILINQIGYRPKDDKVAILQGSDLNSRFYVCNANTDKIVFSGSLKEAGVTPYGEKEGNQEGEALYLADFSRLAGTGKYYLYHENLGYSDTFTIEDGVYDSLENYLLGQLEKENRNTSALCYQLAGMLFSLELYTEQIKDGEKLQQILKDKIELLRKAQDEETGSVYEVIPDEVTPQKPSGGEISLAATAEYAGVMAMYSCYLQYFDQTEAEQYQEAAEKAFFSISGSLDNVSFDAGYFAVTQLYKRTFRSSYSQAIGQYLSLKEEQTSYTEYNFTPFGDYGYLSAGDGINLEWSRQLMNKVMKQAESISLASVRNHYYVSEEREFYDVKGMLQDMTIMALVNYVITNHEYSTLQKNYLDYFLGRNPDARCLVESFGTRNMPEGAEEMIDETYAALLYLLLQSTK